jgi:gas vesicle protein GvpL/GvpF
MNRVLAYCGLRHRPELSLPSVGVAAAQVRVVNQGALDLLWSQVEWPFAPERMQRSAVEFHGVVHHVFNQAAVIPFRLLSVFESEDELAAFAARHQERFLEDLERLKDSVQMEFVVYPAPGRAPQETGSGKAYLEQKAALARMIAQQVSSVRERLGDLGRQVVARESKSGHRVFVLVERGREAAFREAVSAVAVPEGLARRSSGPWPAAEFLSEQVKTPQTAGAK